MPSSIVYRPPVSSGVLSSAEHVPDHEDEAEADHRAQDDSVTSLAEVDLVHQAVDHGKLA